MGKLYVTTSRRSALILVEVAKFGTRAVNSRMSSNRKGRCILPWSSGGGSAGRVMPEESIQPPQLAYRIEVTPSSMIPNLAVPSSAQGVGIRHQADRSRLQSAQVELLGPPSRSRTFS